MIGDNCASPVGDKSRASGAGVDDPGRLDAAGQATGV
jgi:hypothetical protein